MPRKQRFSETIIHKLREADSLITQGRTVREAAKQIGLLQTKALRWHDAQPSAVVRNGCRGPQNPPKMATREGWKQKAAMFHKAFPDLHTEIDQIVAEGNLVVTAITSTGTHQGEVMGISATGKKISVRGVHINKIVDGKIVDRWELTDVMGLMVQPGVVTPPGG